MSEQVLVKAEDIRLIAKNIDTKREEINTIYKSEVLPVLNSSEDCLKVSGLKYDDVSKSFNDLFISLDEHLGKLSKVLVEQIIPGYEASSAIIKQYFNSEFAEQLTAAMAKMNGK